LRPLLCLLHRVEGFGFAGFAASYGKCGCGHRWMVW
jgi:hypothetical protein